MGKVPHFTFINQNLLATDGKNPDHKSQVASHARAYHKWKKAETSRDMRRTNKFLKVIKYDALASAKPVGS